MFKVLKSILYLNLQVDLFMITFALIFDFKQVQSCLVCITSYCVIFSSFVVLLNISIVTVLRR